MVEIQVSMCKMVYIFKCTENLAKQTHSSMLQWWKYARQAEHLLHRMNYLKTSITPAKHTG